MNIICPICTRDTPEPYQEKHHLIPRCRKGKETILVCKNCGDILHQLFTPKQMEKMYNNLGAILSNSDVQTWIAWVRKKPDDFSICMATKKRK